MSTLTALIGHRLFPANVQYGDIVVGLPLAPGTCDAIYASHVLEHLARNDVVRALANTYRLLRPGDVFRMIVPDLEWRARRYVRARAADDVAAADAFIESCNIGATTRGRGPMAILRAAFGNSSHLWMYDEAAMTHLLSEAGFVNIHRCDIGDSPDAMFGKVEDRGRFYDQEQELAVEACKP